MAFLGSQATQGRSEFKKLSRKKIEDYYPELNDHKLVREEDMSYDEWNLLVKEAKEAKAKELLLKSAFTRGRVNRSKASSGWPTFSYLCLIDLLP